MFLRRHPGGKKGTRLRGTDRKVARAKRTRNVPVQCRFNGGHRLMLTLAHRHHSVLEKGGQRAEKVLGGKHEPLALL
jgi:hypothetical protein